MTFRIRGRYPATASLCKTWTTNVGFAAPVSGPTSPESLATPLSLSLTPASIADTRALLSLDEERWPQREQRLALRRLRGRARRPGAVDIAGPGGEHARGDKRVSSHFGSETRNL